MGSTLGVSTLLYLPVAFFNILSPLLSVVYGFTGFRIEKASAEDRASLVAAESADDDLPALLQQLAALRDSGVLTEAEFDALKARVLDAG